MSEAHYRSLGCNGHRPFYPFRRLLAGPLQRCYNVCR